MAPPTMESLQSELDQAKQDLAAFKMAKKVAEKESKKSKDRVRTLIEKLSEMNKETAAVQRELLNIREEREELRGMLETAPNGQCPRCAASTAQQDRLRKQLVVINKEVSQMQRKSIMDKETISSYKKQLRAAKADKHLQSPNPEQTDDALSETAGSCSEGRPSAASQVRLLEAQAANLSEKLQIAEKRCEEFQNELRASASSSTEEKLLRQIDQLRENCEQLSEAKDRAEESLALQTELMDELVASQASNPDQGANEELLASEQRVKQLEARVSASASGGEEAMAAVMEELRLSELEKEAYVEAAAEEVSDLKLQLEIAQESSDQAVEVQMRLEDVEAERQELFDSMVEAKLELEALRAALEEAEAAKAGGGEAVEAAEAKSREVAALAASQIKQLQAELQQAQSDTSKADALQQQLRESEEAGVAAQAELASLRGALDELATESSSAQHKAQALEAAHRTQLDELAVAQKAELEAATEKAGAEGKAALVELEALRGAVDSMAAAAAEAEELRVKYRREVGIRKKLYNELQELRGNLRVFCRMRPAGEQELAEMEGVLPLTLDPEAGEVTVCDAMKDKGVGRRTFSFDETFAGCTQAQVFGQVEPLITSVLDGFNVCIFAYGQTGSGKTFTMEGPPEDPGVSLRATQRVFEEIGVRAGDEETQVTVAMMEVYCDEVRCLLDPGSKEKVAIGHEGKVTVVKGLRVVEVAGADDVASWVQKGQRHRATGKTNMNEHSSRSHLILQLQMHVTNKHTGVETHGKLMLVDLAGSERVGKSGAEGARLKEAMAINKSLSALGDVIRSLAQGGAHVPYRNSKLTHLLADSLGGNSKTLMFCNVSPRQSDVPETLCSLNFAANAKDVTLGPAVKNCTSKSPSVSPKR